MAGIGKSMISIKAAVALEAAKLEQSAVLFYGKKLFSVLLSYEDFNSSLVLVCNTMSVKDTSPKSMYFYIINVLIGFPLLLKMS